MDRKEAEKAVDLVVRGKHPNQAKGDDQLLKDLAVGRKRDEAETEPEEGEPAD